MIEKLNLKYNFLISFFFKLKYLAILKTRYFLRNYFFHTCAIIQCLFFFLKSRNKQTEQVPPNRRKMSIEKTIKRLL